jgi:hypothetical protein
VKKKMMMGVTMFMVVTSGLQLQKKKVDDEQCCYSLSLPSILLLSQDHIVDARHYGEQKNNKHYVHNIMMTSNNAICRHFLAPIKQHKRMTTTR